MSGVLLLINKNRNNKDLVAPVSDRLKRQTQGALKQYFNNIHIRKDNPNEILIEFSQNDTSCFHEDKHGNWLASEGMVFSLHDTKAYNARELLELYMNLGENEFANSLDGHFVIKIYDARQNTYLVINDYIKDKTNFICETDDFILITPFLITTSIIKKAELDLFAFNEFMWRYYILSDKSILKGVSRLSPASIYRITNGTISHKQYWDWPHQYSKLSFSDTVEKTVKSMRETGRLIDQSLGKPCIDFTMGQDSRQIVSAFTNQHLPFATATFGKSDFYEVRSVKELAERHNIENHNIQLHKDYNEDIWKIFKRAVILGSCEEPGQLLGRILYMRNQYSKFGNVSVNGMDGHFYKNGLWDELYSFNLYREPKQFNIELFLKLRALSNNYRDDIFQQSFKKIKNDSRQYFTNLAQEAIKDHLKSPVSIQVDRFDLYHWLNFGIASNNATNALFPSLSPLLLRRNLEHALRVPVKWKFNLSKYQRAVVYNLDPSLAKEPTDFAGVNMMPKNALTSIPFSFRYYYFQSKRFRNKIKTKLGFKVETHLQEAWNYLPIYTSLFENDDFQKCLVIDNMYLSEILQQAEWKKLMHNYRNSEFKTVHNFEFLFKIISVEYFLKSAHEF